MARFDPPEEPNCKPEDAELFDNDLTYGMALGICKDCPIRDYCLDWVDPARNYYDGVVGGVAWHDGKPLNRWTNINRDGTLVSYLARRNLLKKLN
jgi:hypothetical protein